MTSIGKNCYTDRIVLDDDIVLKSLPSGKYLVSGEGGKISYTNEIPLVSGSDQTVEGVKTFTSLIQGSVSGNSASCGNSATTDKLNNKLNIGTNLTLASGEDEWDASEEDTINLDLDLSSYARKDQANNYSGTQTFVQKIVGNIDTSNKLKNARNIGGVSFDGSVDIDLPGVNAAGNQDTTGNSATATTLQAARNIGGVSFNGSADIDLPGVNASGNQDTTGNSATATTLQTARMIGGVSFNGSADIDLPGVNASGNQNTTGNSATATKIASIDNNNIVQLTDTQTLTNKTLTSPTITGAGSIAGSFTGDLIGNSATATKIASIDNNNIVQLTDTQTLTNKTLTSPTITGTGAIAGSFTGDLTGNITGNADTATTLQIARTIAGVSFDGSANIDLASTGLSDTNTLIRNTDDRLTKISTNTSQNQYTYNFDISSSNETYQTYNFKGNNVDICAFSKDQIMFSSDIYILPSKYITYPYGTANEFLKLDASQNMVSTTLSSSDISDIGDYVKKDVSSQVISTADTTNLKIKTTGNSSKNSEVILEIGNGDKLKLALQRSSREFKIYYAKYDENDGDFTEYLSMNRWGKLTTQKITCENDFQVGEATDFKVSESNGNTVIGGTLDVAGGFSATMSIGDGLQVKSRGSSGNEIPVMFGYSPGSTFEEDGTMAMCIGNSTSSRRLHIRNTGTGGSFLKLSNSEGAYALATNNNELYFYAYDTGSTIFKIDSTKNFNFYEGSLTTTSSITAGSLVAPSITSSTGTVNFGDDNITTTGDITCDEITCDKILNKQSNSTNLEIERFKASHTTPVWVPTNSLIPLGPGSYSSRFRINIKPTDFLSDDDDTSTNRVIIQDLTSNVYSYGGTYFKTTTAQELFIYKEIPHRSKLVALKIITVHKTTQTGGASAQALEVDIFSVRIIYPSEIKETVLLSSSPSTKHSNEVISFSNSNDEFDRTEGPYNQNPVVMIGLDNAGPNGVYKGGYLEFEYA